MEYTLDISFPPLPSTVTKVGELIASGETDPNALVDIVKRDPVVSINVLQRVNSAYYGVRRSVDSVEQAVRLLGFTEVTTIAIIEGMSKMQNRFTLQSRSIFRDILRSAVFTGRFAQKFSEALSLPWEWTRPSFSAGLLYATGRLVLLHAMPGTYAELVQEIGAPLPTADDESRVFGPSHETLAPRLCAHWKLPTRLCDILCAVPTPMEVSDGPLRTLARTIRSGSQLARQDLAGEPLATPDDLQPIDADDLDALVTEGAEDAAAYSVEVGCL